MLQRAIFSPCVRVWSFSYFCHRTLAVADIHIGQCVYNVSLSFFLLLFFAAFHCMCCELRERIMNATLNEKPMQFTTVTITIATTLAEANNFERYHQSASHEQYNYKSRYKRPKQRHNCGQGADCYHSPLWCSEIFFSAATIYHANLFKDLRLCVIRFMWWLAQFTFVLCWVGPDFICFHTSGRSFQLTLSNHIKMLVVFSRPPIVECMYKLNAKLWRLFERSLLCAAENGNRPEMKFKPVCITFWRQIALKIF